MFAHASMNIKPMQRGRRQARRMRYPLTPLFYPPPPPFLNTPLTWQPHSAVCIPARHISGSMKWILALLLVGLLAGLSFAQKEDGDSEKTDDWYANYDRPHPCAEKNCGLGYECDIDEEDRATCVCIRKCHPDSSAVQVCTTQNVTYKSECEFYRQKCLCNSRNEDCQDSRVRSADIDYFGHCQELGKCTQEGMEEFPIRMREWLFLVMEELDRRNDLTGKAHDWVEEAKRMGEHKWVLPVIWKFCDLDVSHNRDINWNELFPITAPLKPMEHCTVSFLKKCDSNNNGNISLEEWGICLGLSQDEIKDRCDELQ